ncbi:MAG TPA: hypothetical protein VK846_16670 [Candidatus Limnocylindria bacterium]|nr:hypothetical protein [Candidatus Limnocylindria bacterium]
MLNRGYSDKDIKKVLGENIVHTLREAERVAHKLQ